MAITFRGCCLEVYGQYANANYTVVLDNQRPRTYTGMNLDLDDAHQHPQSLLYLVDNLSEDDLHTVLMTNLDSLEQRPFYFDYAVISSTKSIDFGTTTGVNVTKGRPNHTATTSKKTNIGAIAGATVAGIIILSIIGVAAFLLLKSKKKRACEALPYVVSSSNYVQATPANATGLLASGSVNNVSSLSKTTSSFEDGVTPQRQVGLSSIHEEDSGINNIDHIEAAMLPPAYNSEWNQTLQS